jgi:hypothetical protein
MSVAKIVPKEKYGEVSGYVQFESPESAEACMEDKVIQTVHGHIECFPFEFEEGELYEKKSTVLKEKGTGRDVREDILRDGENVELLRINEFDNKRNVKVGINEPDLCENLLNFRKAGTDTNLRISHHQRKKKILEKSFKNEKKNLTKNNRIDICIRENKEDKFGVKNLKPSRKQKHVKRSLKRSLKFHSSKPSQVRYQKLSKKRAHWFHDPKAQVANYKFNKHSREWGRIAPYGAFKKKEEFSG